MSVLVSMNVRCIGEECLGCRDLQIGNDQLILINGGIINKLVCKNYRRCECIKEHILKESEKKEKHECKPNEEGTK